MLDRLKERIFALYYPYVLEIAERAGQRETRRRLLAEAQGRVLELGAGSGINLPHYTDAVTELVISEPSASMLAHLRSELDGGGTEALESRLVQSGAESLPFEDDSFDTVVATFILCTVPDPVAVLREIDRVLKPGGRYLFLEHVRAGDGTRLARFQDGIEFLHTQIAAGCHPNRRTWETLEASPLEVERLEHGRQPRAPATVRPTIIGAARKRAVQTTAGG